MSLLLLRGDCRIRLGAQKRAEWIGKCRASGLGERMCETHFFSVSLTQLGSQGRAESLLHILLLAYPVSNEGFGGRVPGTPSSSRALRKGWVMGIVGALYGRGGCRSQRKDHMRWAQNPTLQKTKGGAPGGFGCSGWPLLEKREKWRTPMEKDAEVLRLRMDLTS